MNIWEGVIEGFDSERDRRQRALDLEQKRRQEAMEFALQQRRHGETERHNRAAESDLAGYRQLMMQHKGMDLAADQSKNQAEAARKQRELVLKSYENDLNRLGPDQAFAGPEVAEMRQIARDMPDQPTAPTWRFPGMDVKAQGKQVTAQMSPGQIDLGASPAQEEEERFKGLFDVATQKIAQGKIDRRQAMTPNQSYREGRDHEKDVQAAGKDLKDLARQELYATQLRRHLTGQVPGKTNSFAQTIWKGYIQPEQLKTKEEIELDLAMKNILTRIVRPEGGAALTEMEYRNELDGRAMSPRHNLTQFRIGLRNTLDEFSRIASQTRAKYHPDVINTLKARGGVVDIAPATPPAPGGPPALGGGVQVTRPPSAPGDLGEASRPTPPIPEPDVNGLMNKLGQINQAAGMAPKFPPPPPMKPGTTWKMRMRELSKLNYPREAIPEIIKQEFPDAVR